MPAWLEYTYADTLMHRAHPLVKAVVMGLLLLLSGLYWDLRYLSIIGAIGLVFVRLSRVPLSWFKVLSGILIAFIPLTLVGILGQTSPGLFKVYPRDLVSITLFVVNLGPFGQYGISVGGLLWGVANDLRIGIILLYTYSFIYSTSFSDIIEMLDNSRVPQKLTFVIMVAYRFVPQMWREIQQIVTAIKLRGWELRSRNPSIIIERTVPIITALLGQALGTIDEVNLATRIRAYGEHRRTALKYARTSLTDKAVILAAVALFGFAAYNLIVFGRGLL